MVYAYVRVSTEHQNTENQMTEILKFSDSEGICVDEWVQEKISGTKIPELRKLGELLKKATIGDLIICTELSRLGRSIMMIMSILQTLQQNKIDLMTIKDNFRLGNNLESTVLAFAFGISAEIERQLISERTKMGIQQARLNGKHIGRPKGSHPASFKLDPYTDYIFEQLELGRSKSSLAKELKVSRRTLYEHLKRINERRKSK